MLKSEIVLLVADIEQPGGAQASLSYIQGRFGRLTALVVYWAGGWREIILAEIDHHSRSGPLQLRPVRHVIQAWEQSRAENSQLEASI